MNVSVCMIVKNCSQALRECLLSLKPFLQEGDEVVVVDTGSSDDTPVVPRILFQDTSIQVQVHKHPELNKPGMLDLVKKYLPDKFEECQKDAQFSDGFLANFAEARTLAEGYATNPIRFWLDSDDVLVGGAELRAQAEEFFKDEKRYVLFLPYEYAFDVDGACNTILWRERLYRAGMYEWKGRCHESLIPKTPEALQVHRLQTPGVTIQHKHARPSQFSDIRNFSILMDQYETEEYKDPRTEFYIGNACRGLLRWDAAIRWYSKTLLRSGNRDDRLTACLNIGYGYLVFNRPHKAWDWFLQATKIWPEEPRAYFGIAKCCFDEHRWQDCLIFTQIGFSMGIPPHLTAVDPLSFTFYPHVFECLSLQHLGNHDAAVKIAQQMAEMRPGFQPGQALLQEMMHGKGSQVVQESLRTVLGMAFSEAAAKEIMQRIKPEIRKSIPEIQIEPYATKPERSVTFFCGKTLEPWDGSSLKDGVGGSEKMVIQLGERLAARGWKVDVYGHPKPENRYKCFSGVNYRPAESLDIQHPRDILVLWRSPALLDAPWRARKILVDLHDVANPADFTPARAEKAAAFIFKSEYHRQGAPSLTTKAVVLRNAIDTALLKQASQHPPTRNYHKVVWTSSGDRGLRGALLAYAQVKNEFPDSEFHIFYGFTPLYLEKAAGQQYQYFGDCQAERNMFDYCEECFELMDRVGAVQHGRVGTEKLYQELLSSGVWLYPTLFPEISCISAMEAQACGVFPLCSDTAALKETVTFGSFIPPLQTEVIASALRGVMQKGADFDTYRQQMMDDARSRFSLEGLADEWEKLMN